MNTAPLEETLRRTIGLDIRSIGRCSLDRAIERRAQLIGVAPVEYVRQVEQSPQELQELVEALVVPETWFFRQREAFDALAALAVERLRGGVPCVRVLSVPCSTGEEPYSIAMALLDQRLDPMRFSIDAVDISSRSLAAAERGIFTANSFRGEHAAIAHYFTAANRHGRDAVSPVFAVADAVKARVRFRQGNLLAADFLSGEPVFDAVFCRNLLIYFDPDGQQRALRTIDRLLASDGMLFVGPADAFVALTFGFEPVRRAGAAAYRKASSAVRPERAEPARVAARPRARTATRRLVPAHGIDIPPIAVLREAEAPAEASDMMSTIRALADAGRLDDAGAACRRHMDAHGPSAEGYYLLGLIADASGDAAAAEREYRKAVYLDPDHHEALSHLALLRARAGDRRRALLLTARGRRAADARHAGSREL